LQIDKINYLCIPYLEKHTFFERWQRKEKVIEFKLFWNALSIRPQEWQELQDTLQLRTERTLQTEWS